MLYIFLVFSEIFMFLGFDLYLLACLQNLGYFWTLSVYLPCYWGQSLLGFRWGVTHYLHFSPSGWESGMPSQREKIIRDSHSPNPGDLMKDKLLT